MARPFRLYVLMINLKLACRTLFKTPFVTIDRDRLAGAGDRRERRDLLAVQPDAAPAAARPGAGSPGEHRLARPQAGFGVVRQRGRLRLRVHLSRCSATSSARRPCSPGWPRTSCSPPTSRFDGQTLTGEGELVSGSYFPVLGVQPALGRLLGPQDDQTVGESHVVVLSHAYWQTRFAASPTVLGAKMIVNGQPMTIVGVAPRGFGGTTLGSKPAGVRPDHAARA